MCISVILYFFISTLSFRFEIGAKKRRLTEIFFFFKCVPALHILSTESKETIQHKLQNDYFMLRKHSKKAFAVVVFHSTEDQQKRQPSPLPSHTEPGGSPQPQDLPEKSSCFSSRGPQEEGAGLTGGGGAKRLQPPPDPSIPASLPPGCIALQRCPVSQTKPRRLLGVCTTS